MPPHTASQPKKTVQSRNQGASKERGINSAMAIPINSETVNNIDPRVTPLTPSIYFSSQSVLLFGSILFVSFLPASADLPLKINATARSSLPQERQNFTSSAFGVAH